LKVVESFPLTEDGWARAWQSLATQNTAAVPQIQATLGAREADAERLRTRDADSREVAELEVNALLSLRGVAYLGGYVQESAITPGVLYDVRFLEDRLVVSAHRQAKVLAEVPYSQVEDVEICVFVTLRTDLATFGRTAAALRLYLHGLALEDGEDVGRGFL
jgi:hypothetical protein